jgi:predicted enzyme related to lactoylglutathione lyase
MELHTAIFYTNNIAEITSFYRDFLGWRLEFQDGDRFASFIFDNRARLGIKKADAQREIPGAQTIIVSVQGIDKLDEELKRRGARYYKKIENYDWGRSFSVLDPDGNKIEFLDEHDRA